MAETIKICVHGVAGRGYCDISGTGTCEACDEYHCPTERLVEYAPVVHGQWDGDGDGLTDGEIVLDVWYCSECGYCIDDGTDDPCVLPNYCPNCGAKMDGGDSGGR